MQFRVLGPLEVRTDDGLPCRLVRRKPRVLLAAFLLSAHKIVSTDQALDWLWAAQPPKSARQNLYGYLSELRKQLGEGTRRKDRITALPHTGRFQLRVDAEELDSDVFEGLAAQGRKAAAEGAHDVAIERLTRSLGLWRTELVLEGIDLPDALRAEATRLERLRESTEEALFEARLAAGQHHEVIPELEAATVRRPLSEPLWAMLVLAIYRSGRQADALATYREIRGLLEAELGLGPGPDLRHLEQQVIEGSPELVHPSRQAQLVVPAELNADSYTFTGREDELERLATLVADSSPRRTKIAAIDGMGGVGKTTLATHAAHLMASRFPDGQVLIDLNGFTHGASPLDPSTALDRLLRKIGIPAPDIPPMLEDRAAFWRTSLVDRRMLILLDNAACEAQIRPLLPGSSDCFVVVTSRHRLVGLDDTCPISLDVLPSPDAMTLFARSVGIGRTIDRSARDFSRVIAMCGGLPLAICITASRFRHRPAWTLRELADRLNDHDGRLAEFEAGERSVARTIDLSYTQLGATEQQLFRLLGRHPGTDYEPYAAAAMLDSTLERARRALDRLLDCNLVLQQQEGRYKFHDLVGAFAAKVCDQHESRADVRSAMTRLLDHYAHAVSNIMDAAYPLEADVRPHPMPARTPFPNVGDSERAQTWLDAEMGNLLAAASYADENGWTRHTIHLSTALHRHLRTRGRYSDAIDLHTRALDAARRIGDRHGEYDALCGLGHARRAEGLYSAATACFEQAIDIARELGYRAGDIELGAIGNIHLAQGRLTPAERCFVQALEVARATGDRSAEVGSLHGLGSVQRQREQYERATDYYREGLRIAREIGDRIGQMAALTSLGFVSHATACLADATNFFAQALSHARGLGHYDGELAARMGLGSLLLTQRELGSAADNYQRMLEVARQIGDRTYQLEALLGMGRTEQTRDNPSEAIPFLQQALECAIEIDLPGDRARVHNAFGRAYGSLGRHRLARQHWQRALDILTDLDRSSAEETTAEEIRHCLERLVQPED